MSLYTTLLYTTAISTDAATWNFPFLRDEAQAGPLSAMCGNQWQRFIYPPGDVNMEHIGTAYGTIYGTVTGRDKLTQCFLHKVSM